MNFWNSLIRFQTEKVAPWTAARNALGLAIPLAAGAWFGSLPLGLAAALGALNVCYSDSQGPYLQRGREMLAASLLVGTAVILGSLCGSHSMLVLAIAGVWAFAAGMTGPLRPAASDLGVISLVTMVIYAASPMTPARAFSAGAVALAGGLLQTLLSMAAWPWHRYAPERRVLAGFYSELARAATLPYDATSAPPASAASSEAQTALATLERDSSIEARRLRMLLSEAERARVTMVALARQRVRWDREEAPESLRQDMRSYMNGVAQALGDIAQLLRGNRGSARVKLPANGFAAGDAAHQVDALNGQIRAAAELAADALPEGELAFEHVTAMRQGRSGLAATLETLRANFTLQSAVLRHAVRLSVGVAIGVAIPAALGLARAYWVPMTVAIVLKPDFSATFGRGIQRLAGTFAGLAFSTALFHVLPRSVTADILSIVLLTFVLRCFGSANYAIFVTAITALVVSLLSAGGVEPGPVMMARGLNTLIGGGIAVVVYGVWPTWERTQLPESIAGMLDNYRLFFRHVREAYLGADGGAETLDRARLDARLGRSNAEASLERYYSEPGSPRGVTALSGVFASSHRLANALMALEAGLYSRQPVQDPASFTKFANDVELSLYYLSSVLRGSDLGRDAFPDLRAAHQPLARDGLIGIETDRITNSINTLCEETWKWLRPGET